MGLQLSSSPSSSLSASSSPEHDAGRSSSPAPAPAKRPAGRTKFRETRHPVFRGVRRRGAACRWVCEVRVPGKRGARLWLGTYVTAEAAARAHDAAMLALGSSAARLNFPDSAWLLNVPPALAGLADVRSAAVQAVADFERRETAAIDIAAAATDEATSRVSERTSSSGNAGSLETSEPSADDARFGEVPVAMDSDMFSRLDLFREMDLGMYYYTSLAEALLVDPPPPETAAGAYWDNGDCVEGGADVALWSY